MKIPKKIQHEKEVKKINIFSGDPDLISWSGGSPGERNGNPLQFSCLGNPMDRGAWRAIPWGIARVRCNLVTK